MSTKYTTTAATAAITTPQDLRALTHDLSASTWTLAVIGALLESGLSEHLREPRSLDDLASRCSSLTKSRIERSLALAVCSGVITKDEQDRYKLAEGALSLSQQPFRATLLGDIRSTLMQSLALLDSAGAATDAAAKSSSGWHHTNPVLLQAQGNASMVFPQMFKATLIASMGDLAARFEAPNARFLDIGVGVAALSIAMCRVWPTLHAVGLDVFDVPLGIARENVARAGLADRIELRKLAVEDLRDEASGFDLAWLPSIFIPASVLPSALARVHASLRPGGFLIMPIFGMPSETPARSRAFFALLNDLWGGPLLALADAESLVKKAGFSSVRIAPGPASNPPLVVAER